MGSWEAELLLDTRDLSFSWTPECSYDSLVAGMMIILTSFLKDITFHWSMSETTAITQTPRSSKSKHRTGHPESGPWGFRQRASPLRTPIFSRVI